MSSASSRSLPVREHGEGHSRSWALPARGTGRRRVVILVLIQLLQLLFVLWALFTLPLEPQLVVLLLLLVAGLGIGVYLAFSVRRDRAAWLRAVANRRREREVEQERRRIVVALADTVTRSLSIINESAASGAASLDSDPSAVHDALAVIQSRSAATLDEVRSGFGFINSDSEAGRP
ncbi:hypothetical protein WDJ51_00460 [Rathayibacter sp. YIM 133350]|uniref:hypothetical protein n=1 Tax=Rathayibacter sp. YIM 133350 TaxID=3131992 RepID=UPI00307E8046